KNRDHTLTAINVTFTDEVDKREMRALSTFRGNFHETRKCFVITRDLRKEEDGIQFIPLWEFLLNSEAF
ncbi:MAG: ATP-binding protein, partial [bacterium]